MTTPLLLSLEIDFLSDRFSTRYGPLRKYGPSLKDYSSDINCDFRSVVKVMSGDNAAHWAKDMNQSPIRQCVQELYDGTRQYSHLLSDDVEEHAQFILTPLLLPLTLSVYHDLIAERIDFRYALHHLSKSIAFLYTLRVPSECGDSPQIPDFDFQVLHRRDVKGNFYLAEVSPRKGHGCRSYILLEPDSTDPDWTLWVLYYGQTHIDHKGLQVIRPMIDLNFEHSEIEKRLKDWNKRGFILDLDEKYAYAWQCRDYLRAVLRYHGQSVEKSFFIYEWLFPVSVGSEKKRPKITRACYDFLCKDFTLDKSSFRVEMRSVFNEIIDWTGVIGLLLGVATVVVFLCGAGLNIPLLSCAAFFCLICIVAWSIDGFVTHMLLSDYDNDKEAVPGFELFDIPQLQLLSSTVDALYGATHAERSMSTLMLLMGCIGLALLISAFGVALLSHVSGVASVCIMISYVAAGCFGLSMSAWTLGLVARERRISLFRSLQQMPPPFIEESAVPDNEPVRKAQVKFLWQMWNVHQGRGPDGGALAPPLRAGEVSTDRLASTSM